ncbi:MAG: hypothetical protein DMG78_32400, partial [Acidobacteria bacterium]
KFLINTGSQAVNVTGTFGSIVVGAGPLFAIEANLSLTFPGVEISGVFGFQNVTEGSSTVQAITGSSVRVFIGDPIPSTSNSIGLELTGGQAVFVDQGGLRAGFISGVVRLVGVPGLTLQATMTLRINQTTGAMSRTFVVDGQEKKVVFTANEVSTATDGAGTRIPLVGSNNFEAFIGKGPSRLPDGSTNPDAVGLLISNIQMALAVFTAGPLTGKFAFDGQGSIGFLGLPGLQVGLNAVNATFGLRLNRTGQAITTAINVPVITAVNATTGENTYTTIPLTFADASDIAQFKAGVRIHFDINSQPVFDLSGMMLIRQLPGGEADVTVTGLTPGTGASIRIYSGSTEVFGFSGTADFRIGGTEGFKLQDFRINSVQFFGASLNLTPPGGRPLTADLAGFGDGGVIARDVLNTRKYIDVIFNDVNGVGLNEASITDSSDLEFKILRGGTDVTSELGTVTTARLSGNTYRYSFTGSLTQDAEYSIEFQPNSWQDNAATANKAMKAAQDFIAYIPSSGFGGSSGLTTNQSGANGALPAPPTARLLNPAPGVAVNPVTLAAQRFIDVVFESRTNADIDPATINGDELNLSNEAGQSGLKDAQL